MGFVCWFKGHDFEECEYWEGDAYGVLTVKVTGKRCTRCGAPETKVHVIGKLTKKQAEDVVKNTGMPVAIEMKALSGLSSFKGDAVEAAACIDLTRTPTNARARKSPVVELTDIVTKK